MPSIRNKLQVYMADETFEWVKKQAEVFGISSSSFVNMALVQYKIQMENLKSMQDLPNLIKAIQELKDNSDVMAK